MASQAGSTIFTKYTRSISASDATSAYSTTTPVASLHPDRLLVNASSAGSLTDNLEEAPHGREQGGEIHVVCMGEEDAEASLAATEDETEHETEIETEGEKKPRKQRERERLHDLTGNGVDEIAHSRKTWKWYDRVHRCRLVVNWEIETLIVELSVVAMRCDWCGRHAIRARPEMM
ncbi:uncharacterized protein M421DRAFT_5978 [Didymella exigua CBS 183.55]|uniref:Uncharacterized protein n=1 Tax=Didymella exigua CBS 183.55 TaxID=1150837 RepID=A0A6A5RMY6_9PLEO|nr:uncharacterized protein M421DRAFT_5978 [Didymella exigua CBS 183.55]KAF1927716.1 hypothetical protein M421DRAFT_5978 [Didymella exigua CBS 183.55]